MTTGQFELSIPGGILDRIVTECSSELEQKSALANYIVTTLPNVTWEGIAAKLYSLNEMRAMKQAQMFIHRIAGEYMCLVYGGMSVLSERKRYGEQY